MSGPRFKNCELFNIGYLQNNIFTKSVYITYAWAAHVFLANLIFDSDRNSRNSRKFPGIRLLLKGRTA